MLCSTRQHPASHLLRCRLADHPATSLYRRILPRQTLSSSTSVFAVQRCMCCTVTVVALLTAASGVASPRTRTASLNKQIQQHTFNYISTRCKNVVLASFYCEVMFYQTAATENGEFLVSIHSNGITTTKE